MSQLLQWEEIYCFQKFLPLLTRWQLFHYGSGNNNLPMKGNVSPAYIKKKRTPKGIASYEIIWKDDDKCFEGLIPEEQIVAFVGKSSNFLHIFSKVNHQNFTEQNSSLEQLWSTVEPVDLVQKAYPEVVSNYLDTISAKTKKPSKAAKTGLKTTRTTRKKQLVLINSDDNEGNIDNEKLIKPKKIVRKKDDIKSKNIGEYFKKVKRLPRILSPEKKEELQSPKIKTCSTPLSLTELSFDFNNSNDDVQDLSDIIHGIVSNSPTINDLCGRKLYYESVNNQPSPNPCTVEQDEKDESADEFDMIVAGKKPAPIRTYTPTTSRRQTKNSSAVKRHSSENVDDPSHSSTPILIKKFFKRNRIDLKVSNIPSTPNSPLNLSFESIESPKMNEPLEILSTPTSNKNLSFESIRSTKQNNVSHFFCDLTDLTEENDEFEKLLDFRNMKDDVSTDDEDNVPCRDILQDVIDSPPIQLSETFDLDDYVPVSANLKKRIASY